MIISIIGAAGSGKTTLFQAMSGIESVNNTNSTTIATIEVPDERLETLKGIFNPKKTVYARVELSDTVAIEEGDVKNETVSSKALQQMRLSDAFLLVLRNFDNGSPPDPAQEFRTMYSEFILSDMAQIETRLERIKRQSGKKDNLQLLQEQTMLEQCLAHVNEEKPLTTLPCVEGDLKLLRGFQFLSQKPMMVVLNCGEEGLEGSEEVTARIAPSLPPDTPLIAMCGKIEAELALMSHDEQVEFMGEYGIKEIVRSRIIRLAIETLGLITFLTVGEDECRAWPIRKGLNAQEAAGTIHSDFCNKFIRAETVAYDAFIQHNGFAGCKKAGVWRLEGKTYIVQDGDILTIRAGN
jgi:GTP-binding protein YchF